jgi:RimJ/RimL family protein N-acetyltransferase
VIEKCGFRHEGEVKNHFSQPSPLMLENGYHPEKTGLQYAFTKEDIENLAWFQPVKANLAYL